MLAEADETVHRHVAGKKQKRQPELPFLTSYRDYSAATAVVEPTVPDFWRNFSTRPAVSTILCLPVKNGCDSAETSIFTSGYSLPSWVIFSRVWMVERVTNLKSHDRSWKTTSRYSGWVSTFMGFSLSR